MAHSNSFSKLFLHNADYLAQKRLRLNDTEVVALIAAQIQGKDIPDGELLDYISESSTMSKSADYGEQKACVIATDRRLADFLRDTMVKDKGLRCQYIVASEPKGTTFSERVVPVR